MNGNHRTSSGAFTRVPTVPCLAVGPSFSGLPVAGARFSRKPNERQSADPSHHCFHHRSLYPSRLGTSRGERGASRAIGYPQRAAKVRDSLGSLGYWVSLVTAKRASRIVRIKSEGLDRPPRAAHHPCQAFLFFRLVVAPLHGMACHALPGPCRDSGAAGGRKATKDPGAEPKLSVLDPSRPVMHHRRRSECYQCVRRNTSHTMSLVAADDDAAGRRTGTATTVWTGAHATASTWNCTGSHGTVAWHDTCEGKKVGIDAEPFWESRGCDPPPR